MNDEKIEIKPVRTKAKLKSVRPQTASRTLSGSTIPFSYKVRNLWVYFDSNLSAMDQHVNLLCRSVFQNYAE